jgi:predicted transcriptional regulator
MKQGKWVHEPTAIEQTGVGLLEETARRLDRLRAATGESRGRVINRALTHPGGLDGLEVEYAAEIEAFGKLARSARRTWQEYARWYAETFSHRTRPPRVAEIAGEVKAMQEGVNA